MLFKLLHFVLELSKTLTLIFRRKTVQSFKQKKEKKWIICCQSCKLMAYSINLNNKQLNSVNEIRAGYLYATFYLIKLWIKFSNSKQLNLGNVSRAGYPSSTFYLIKLVKLFCLDWLKSQNTNHKGKRSCIDRTNTIRDKLVN